jgi:DeoR family ulaG and ulaABCDEF operon transcriptional repressor
MHATERDEIIVGLLRERGFVSFRELDRRLSASPATLRRDLDRLESGGLITRVRGGARLSEPVASTSPARLAGVPFHENIGLNRTQKEAIGEAAASLCERGESIIIDGGSTTLQMCPFLEPLGLNVLTNSLHIVSALLPQAGTTVSLPAGTLFREQNIVLSPFDDDGVSRYRATKLFMGAASIGPHGLMQRDVLLIKAEQRLLRRADRVVVLADSSKFKAPAGHTVCELTEIDVVVTDSALADADRRMLEQAGVEVVIAAS